MNGFIILEYTSDVGKLLLAVADTATGCEAAGGLVLDVNPDMKIFRGGIAGTGCETAEYASHQI